ncbi:LPS export ABC transporter periplasmic protein LptC [Shigella flexneri]
MIAQHVEYYSNQAVSWFTQPVLTTFDKDKIQDIVRKSR